MHMVVAMLLRTQGADCGDAQFNLGAALPCSALLERHGIAHLAVADDFAKG